MSEFSVSVNNVSRAYDKVQAVSDISFQVEKGMLFGLIGPDGGGKTTLFRIITSLLLPDTGSAVVEGFDTVKDFREIRKIIGYMPGRFSLYMDLTVEENLSFFATIFKTTIQENYELIKDIYVQIEPFKDRKAGNLSGGMKQKLALSCALIHKPKLLVLDEPTTGVDAVSRKEFWEMLKKLQKQGITIVVSTPYMDEASLCDKVALIQKGRILSIDSPQGIINQFTNPMYGIKSSNMFKLREDLINQLEVLSAFRFGDAIHLSISEKADIELIKSKIIEEKHENIELYRIEPNIEDCFMALMSEDDGHG